MIKVIRVLNQFSKVRFFVQSELDPTAKLEIEASNGEVLAKELKKQKVPLAFECSFDCSCSTCSVKVKDLGDYEKLNETQPQSSEERNVLKTEGKLGQRIRLSCQLKVAKELNGMILYI